MSLDVFAGFGVDGFRSFGGGEIQNIGPTSRIHFVVGKNDVGKSNSLRIAYEVLPRMKAKDGRIVPSKLFAGELDTPQGWSKDKPRSISIAIKLTDEVIDNFKLLGAASMLMPILKAPAFTRGADGVAWFNFVSPSDQGNRGVQYMVADYGQLSQGAIEAGVDLGRDFSRLTSTLTHQSAQPESNWDSIVRLWSPWKYIPNIEQVDAIREITAVKEDDSRKTMRNGRGLVSTLANMQMPDYQDHAELTAKFAALQDFVKNVLEDEKARIEIPTSQSTILVHRSNGLILPLHALGTGIAEVIILGAVATSIDNSLICIEEPEVHLHPALQRKLIDYIYNYTSNNYIISTHSASLLDSNLGSISHVAKNEEWTEVSTVLDSRHLARVVADLGNRASDIVQSNYIIWAEGPSDRLYLAYWLKLAAPDLIEGAHYSIMFYGGALLNHLTVDDPEMTDFIDLMRINQNITIVIDSDKKSEEDDLNATKQRILKEAEVSGVHTWVTDGYTIENYIPTNFLRAAIKEEYSDKQYRIPGGRFASPLSRNFVGLATKPSKITIARHVAKADIGWEEWPDNLRENINRIVERIRSANS